MADIRTYIQDTLLDPLKYYPTAIQDTLLELITEKLEKLYEYTITFPEIVTPNSTRLDILKAIANQFLFTIRDEADLQEQINILDNILYVYSRRGSIDTIENMWKYYGGDLPKDVQVIIPSYNLFRYNISPLSGAHVFQDSKTNRTGIYEIKLTNNTYPIPELKKFLLDELVAAGNLIYFTAAVSSDLREDMSESRFDYKYRGDNLINLQLQVPAVHNGLILSGPNDIALSGSYNSNLLDQRNIAETLNLNSIWSGKANIFIENLRILDTLDIAPYIYNIRRKNHEITFHPEFIDECVKIDMSTTIIPDLFLYCTPSSNTIYIENDLYNDNDEKLKPREYFILGESLLGEPLGYELA